MLGETYVNAYRDRRSTLFKHGFVAQYETCEATTQGVPQRYPTLVRLLHKEVDSRLEIDLINVTASVTGGVGLVALLWHHRAPLVLAEWNDTIWLRR